jgi:hypothetical protein
MIPISFKDLSRLACLLVQMVFPWMFDELAGLRELKEVAHIVAEKADWGELYREEALKTNKVCFS